MREYLQGEAQRREGPAKGCPGWSCEGLPAGWSCEGLPAGLSCGGLPRVVLRRAWPGGRWSGGREPWPPVSCTAYRDGASGTHGPLGVCAVCDTSACPSAPAAQSLLHLFSRIDNLALSVFLCIPPTSRYNPLRVSVASRPHIFTSTPSHASAFLPAAAVDHAPAALIPKGNLLFQREILCS